MAEARRRPGAPPVLEVGLTGNVASGKSTVARRWADAGVPVVSADELARAVLAPGSRGLAEVVEAFGDAVVTSTGELDRPRLRALVFGDPEARVRLEAITHPRIARRRRAWVEDRVAEGHTLVVSEIPLLFEAGLEGAVDRIVLVDAPAPLRHRRMVEHRGLDPAEATRILEAQMDPNRKRSRADWIIENDTTLQALEARADEVLAALRQEAGRGRIRIDLHLHTRGSWDSLSDPEAVLARARERGVGRVAITDHNRIGVALEMAARYPDMVIPGEEVKTAEGIDVIGLYLSDEIPRGTPMLETCRLIRGQGGIVYLPHPYAAGKGGSGRYAEALAPEVDVVEVFNARLRSRAANRKAAELAARFGRLAGAGSDAHTPAETGNAWVEVPHHPNEPAALLAALAAGEGEVRVQGQRAGLHVFVQSNAAKLWKKVSGG